MLESLTAVNELGDSFTLQELADLSVSNPVIRRNELMTRLAGCECYADQHEYESVFVTLSPVHPGFTPATGPAATLTQVMTAAPPKMDRHI